MIGRLLLWLALLTQALAPVAVQAQQIVIRPHAIQAVRAGVALRRVTPAPIAPALTPTVLAYQGFSNVSGNTVTNGATFRTAHASGRTTGLRIQKPTASFSGARTTTIETVGFKLSDFAVVGFDIDGIVSSGSITLRFSSDNFVAKRREFTWVYPNYYINGWQRLTVRPDDDGTTAEGGGVWTVIGGQAIDEPINAVQITMSTAANVSMEAYVDRVFGFAAVPTRGAVLLGFSSFGEASIVDSAMPILAQYGITSYWAGDGDVAELPNAGALLQTWYDAGHDIIQSGRNHVDYVANPTLLAPDYNQTRAYFISRGWLRAIDHFVMPFSTSDANTEGILKGLGVRMAKGIGKASLKPNEINLNFKLIGHGGQNIGGMLRANALRLIDQAAMNGTVVNIFAHGVVPGGDGTSFPADTNFIYANDLIAICARMAYWRALGKLDTPSPSQLFNQRGALPVLN